MITCQEKLQNKLCFEACWRRETLRLYGVPEGVKFGTPSMTQFVEKLLRENLKTLSSTTLQIQRARREFSSAVPDHLPGPPEGVLWRKDKSLQHGAGCDGGPGRLGAPGETHRTPGDPQRANRASLSETKGGGGSIPLLEVWLRASVCLSCIFFCLFLLREGLPAVLLRLC